MTPEERNLITSLFERLRKADTQPKDPEAEQLIRQKAAEFPAATREEWLKLVSAALKGAPFDQKLVSRTYDGLRIEPLYERTADAKPVTARALAAPWQVMARLDHPDPSVANAEARHELENGATSLWLGTAGGGPVDADLLQRVLDGVYLHMIPVRLDGGAARVAAIVP